jgi:hypothetical protein
MRCARRAGPIRTRCWGSCRVTCSRGRGLGSRGRWRSTAAWGACCSGPGSWPCAGRRVSARRTRTTACWTRPGAGCPRGSSRSSPAIHTGRGNVPGMRRPISRTAKAAPRPRAAQGRRSAPGRCTAGTRCRHTPGPGSSSSARPAGDPAAGRFAARRGRPAHEAPGSQAIVCTVRRGTTARRGWHSPWCRLHPRAPARRTRSVAPRGRRGGAAYRRRSSRAAARRRPPAGRRRSRRTETGRR